MVSSQVGEGSWSISLIPSDPTKLKLGLISPPSPTHHWPPGAPSRATMAAPPAPETHKCPLMLPNSTPPGTTPMFRSLRRLRSSSRRPRATAGSADDDDDRTTTERGHRVGRTATRGPGRESKAQGHGMSMLGPAHAIRTAAVPAVRPPPWHSSAFTVPYDRRSNHASTRPLRHQTPPTPQHTPIG